MIRPSRCTLLGAYVDGKLEGIVHYLFHRSTWTAGNYCYLQDLFVAEGGRNHGLGRALIEAVYAGGAPAGASRVYWLTHETNETARALYDKVADRRASSSTGKCSDEACCAGKSLVLRLFAAFSDL